MYVKKSSRPRIEPWGSLPLTFATENFDYLKQLFVFCYSKRLSQFLKYYQNIPFCFKEEQWSNRNNEDNNHIMTMRLIRIQAF